MCECNRLCIPSVDATVISATVTGTTAALTINQTLTNLSYFRLRVPCAIINGLAGIDTVTFTDGTNTYTATAFNGDPLSISTLKRYFCKHNRCNDCCRCQDALIAYSSQSNANVQIICHVL